MIGTLDVKINAAHPNLPLTPFYTFVSSPSSVRVTNVPKKIGSWEITKVFVTANYPDNTSRSAECVNVAGCYVATLPLCNVVGESVNGFQITANGVDENGNAVTGYVLGHGDLIVLTRAGNITVGTTTWYFNFKDTQPTNPVKGDACIINGALKWYNGTAWVDFGGLNLSDITLDLNADQATINEKLGEVIRRAGGTVIGCLLLCAAPLAAWCAHVYPTNPDPTHKEFFGKMTRDSLVVTNAPELVETDPTVPTQITNSVELGYLCTSNAAATMASTSEESAKTYADGKDTELKYYVDVDFYNTVNGDIELSVEDAKTELEERIEPLESDVEEAYSKAVDAYNKADYLDFRVTSLENQTISKSTYKSGMRGLTNYVDTSINNISKIYGDGRKAAIDGDANVYAIVYTNSTWVCSTEPTATWTQLERYKWRMDGSGTVYFGWVESRSRYYISPTTQLIDGEASNVTTADTTSLTISEFGTFTRTWTTPVLDKVDALAKVSSLDYSTNNTELVETARAVVRESNGGLWDSSLSVWWTPVMSNGKLTYQATTNVNLNAGN